MKTKYTINSIGWLGIMLLMLLLTATSCKKDENKAPSTGTPPTTTTVAIDKYKFTSANGGSSIYVSDTVCRFTDGANVKFNIPLEYSSKYDTMQVTLGTPILGHVTYRFSHVLKYNVHYFLEGIIMIDAVNAGPTNSPGDIFIMFDQKLVTDSSSIGNYHLTYHEL